MTKPTTASALFALLATAAFATVAHAQLTASNCDLTQPEPICVCEKTNGKHGQTFACSNAALVNSRLLEVRGELQRESGVTHVVARELRDRSGWLGGLTTRVREFQ